MNELTRAASCLADIAHALASGQDPNAHVQRVLLELRKIVPYDRCVLASGAPLVADRRFVVPPLPEADRERLCAKADARLALLSERAPRAQHQQGTNGTAAHLAVPLVSMDEVVGVLLVERDGAGYEAQDLQLLSVVASQLGAYLAMLGKQQEERRAAEALRETAERRTHFLGVLSHELRNPLAPISNALQVLDRVPPGSDKAARARAIIGRQFGHLYRLVNDLLDATRVTSGKVHVDRSRLDLAEVIRRTVEDHRSVFAEAGVELSLETPPGPVWVDGDPVRLAQVVGNLLANAVKFSNAGGRTEVRVGHADGSAVLTVRDDGTGIGPAILPRLFEPFAQGDETLDRSRGGLGLGLALARGLLELHGGVIEARSEGPGRGAEFTVRLPALAAPGEISPAQVGAAGTPAGRRVLIIEDNVDAAQTLRDLLALSGHEVELAFDGREALARVEGGAPDVILCDIGLPGMDGYEVVRALRAVVGGAARIVALTGYGLDVDRERALAAGFDGHLVKPVSIDQIEELLRGPPGR